LPEENLLLALVVGEMGGGSGVAPEVRVVLVVGVVGGGSGVAPEVRVVLVVG